MLRRVEAVLRRAEGGAMQPELAVKGKAKGKGKGNDWHVLLQSAVDCLQVDGQAEIRVAEGEATVFVVTGDYDVEIRAQLLSTVLPLTETLSVSIKEPDEPEEPEEEAAAAEPQAPEAASEAETGPQAPEAASEAETRLQAAARCAARYFLD